MARNHTSERDVVGRPCGAEEDNGICKGHQSGRLREEIDEEVCSFSAVAVSGCLFCLQGCASMVEPSPFPPSLLLFGVDTIIISIILLLHNTTF